MLPALALLATGGVVALARAQSAAATVRALADIQITGALALLGLAAAGPLLESGLLRAGQATVGARLGRWEAVRLAAGIHAANVVIRAAGVAGLGVLLAAHRDGPVDRVSRSAAYVLAREVAHVASAGLVLAALALLAVDGRLSSIIVGGAALFLVSRALHVALLWFAATHPQSVPRWRRLDRLRALAPSFAVALRSVGSRRRALVRMAAWGIAIGALRIGLLWVALRAVGAGTSFNVAVETSGSVAPLGMIGILPAGLGAVDAGLVAALRHSGVAVAAATAGVLLFRGAELWVALAAGVAPAVAATAFGARRRQRLGGVARPSRRLTEQALRFALVAARSARAHGQPRGGGPGARATAEVADTTGARRRIGTRVGAIARFVAREAQVRTRRPATA